MRRHDEPIEDVLARRIRPGGSAVLEVLLYNRLSAEKRALVEARLRTIDRHLLDRDRGASDPRVVAAAIGVSVRSLNRLIVRIAELGAVAALAPTRGAGRVERSDRFRGMSDAADEVVRSMVRGDPRVRMGDVVRRVAEVEDRVSPSTVRRRLLWWRANRDPGEKARFGRVWLLDRCLVDVPVRGPDGSATWLPIELLVDVDTAVVAGGRPLIDSEDADWDILADAARRLSSLPGFVPLAGRTELVIWVLPDPVSDRRAGRVEDHAAGLASPVAFEARRRDRIRPDSEILQIVGAEFPPFRLMPLVVMHSEPVGSGASMAPIDASLVDVALDEVIARINEGAFERLRKTDRPSRSEIDRPSRLAALFAELMAVLEPVVPVTTARSVASELHRLEQGPEGGTVDPARRA